MANGNVQEKIGGQGFTLIELLIVVSVMAVLMGIGFLSFRSLNDRYSVERQMKEIYVDLTNARLRAMQRNRIQFVIFTATQYSVYEDTDPPPDGDTQLDTVKDALYMTKNLTSNFPVTFPAAWSTNSSALRFTPRGFVDTAATSTGVVRVSVDMGGEYDCIIVSDIKNTLGKWDGTSQCNAR